MTRMEGDSVGDGLRVLRDLRGEIHPGNDRRNAEWRRRRRKRTGWTRKREATTALLTE